MELTIDPEIVKKESEEIIKNYGGEICDWLPWIDRIGIRPIEEIIGRALVMNALINIHFEAPTSIIKEWLESNELTNYLTAEEMVLLNKNNNELTEQEINNLYWHIEALWSLLWATSIIDEMPFDRPIEDFMASLCPSLEKNEGTEKFTEKMKLRSIDEIFRKLDLYYRLHWWTKDANLNKNETGEVSLDIIMERRHALEWILHPKQNWEDISLDT